MVSPPEGQPPPRALPATANLDHLKKQAKARLRLLRAQTPDSRLADAQLAVARDYGFASWRALKAGVERIEPAGSHGRLAGYYQLDPEMVSNSVIMFTDEQGQLFVRNSGRPKVPLAPVAPDIFALTGATILYRFEGPPGQLAERVLGGTGTRFVTAVRTDAEQAGKAEGGFARDLAEQARPRTRIAVEPDTLAAYVGFYASAGTAIEVTASGSRLFARVAGQPEYEIQCEAEHSFFYSVLPAQISFRMHDGAAEALILHQHGRSTVFRRTSREDAAECVDAIERRRAEQERPRTRIQLGEEMLGLYVGSYDMDQNMRLIVTAEGDRLFGEMSGQRRFEMFAEAEAQFFLTVAAVQISFIKDSSGRIDRAVIHQHGVDIVLMRAIPEGEGA